ncbi:GNAT family N-acetyltransferase [Desulfocurvus vexinensis]|uniref:GNAT family N-acetyltransferase n=1 Tax=Desulfocurvus vexinensis TaxID=399548 RepID=UPI00048CB928|nr:GNAT family N-acetyltransferase [Desulfocurvus vexinensis]
MRRPGPALTLRPGLTLRPARPGDLDALHALWLDAVSATHGFLSGEDVEFYSRLVREEYLPAGGQVVAHGPGGVVLGFMGLTREDGLCGIDSLFVAPAYHRQGVGRALAEYALRGSRLVRVDVNEQNPGARRFYAALGFVERGRSECDFCGRPYPLLHLEYMAPGAG